jgi:hypothetical protein
VLLSTCPKFYGVAHVRFVAGGFCHPQVAQISNEIDER